MTAATGVAVAVAPGRITVDVWDGSETLPVTTGAGVGAVEAWSDAAWPFALSPSCFVSLELVPAVAAGTFEGPAVTVAVAAVVVFDVLPAVLVPVVAVVAVAAGGTVWAASAAAAVLSACVLVVVLVFTVVGAGGMGAVCTAGTTPVAGAATADATSAVTGVVVVVVVVAAVGATVGAVVSVVAAIRSFADTLTLPPAGASPAVFAVVVAAGVAVAFATPVAATAATGVATTPASSAANASATPVGAASVEEPCCASDCEALAPGTGAAASMGGVSMVLHLLSCGRGHASGVPASAG
jgi:hypothetical protein